MPIQRAPAAIWAALRHNILPGEYYTYALWQPERKMNIDNYLYSHEAARIFRIINRPFQVDPIGDKLAFHDMCVANALPTPTVLAAFAPTGRLREFQSGQPPEGDLFVKPRNGLAGDGTERFRWRGDAFENERGRRIKRQYLDNYLLARARDERRALLVQPNLSNHPDLCVEVNGALATARLVTGHSIHSDVVAIFGFIYFARSDRITAQHGYVALIDVASGRITPAPIKEGSCMKSRSPQADSACKLKYPARLPNWHTALEHVKVAHRICSNFAFVGWDIAFSRDGPMLLEGNANWSADEYQSLTGKPLGHTQFANLLAERLRD
jgi:hypothetical protein